jgi:hypothetical protein
MTILRDSRFEARLFQTKRDFWKEQDWNHFSNSVNFFKTRNWQNHFLAAVGWSARAVDKLTWRRASP